MFLLGFTRHQYHISTYRHLELQRIRESIPVVSGQKLQIYILSNINYALIINSVQLIYRIVYTFVKIYIINVLSIEVRLIPYAILLLMHVLHQDLIVFHLHDRVAEICLVRPNRLNRNETGHFSGTGYGVNLVSLELVLIMTS